MADRAPLPDDVAVDLANALMFAPCYCCAGVRRCVRCDKVAGLIGVPGWREYVGRVLARAARTSADEAATARISRSPDTKRLEAEAARFARELEALEREEVPCS